MKSDEKNEDQLQNLIEDALLDSRRLEFSPTSLLLLATDGTSVALRVSGKNSPAIVESMLTFANLSMEREATLARLRELDAALGLRPAGT